MFRTLLLLGVAAALLSGCARGGPQVLASPQSPPVNFIGEWGVHGQTPGQLDKPVGLAVDFDGRVYIADRGTGFVQKFTLAGVPLQVFEDPAAASATAIAVDAGGGIYIANLQAGLVHVFFPEGDALRLFHVKQQPRFEGPFVFSVDAGGAIYVPDPAGGGIQVFSSKGALIRSWRVPAIPGVARANLVAAVAGPDGFLYVGEGSSGTVLKFSTKGERAGMWRDMASTGKLLGLAVSDDRLFVLRDSSPRLEIWTLDGKEELTDDLGGCLGATSDGASLAVGPGDELLVLDQGAPRVLRFQIRPGQHL